MRKRLWLPALLLIIGAGLLACAQAAPTSPPPTSGGTAKQDTSPGVASAEGVVVPYKKVELSFRVPGHVAKLLVHEGDSVKAGQPLVQLETRDFEEAVREAQAALSSAQAQLAKVKAGARPEEIVSAEQAVAIAEAGVKAAEGGVQDAQGRVAAALAQLDGANAALAKLIAGAGQSELAIAQKRIEEAKDTLYGLQSQRDATHNVLEGQILAAQAQAEIAQIAYDQLQAPARPEDLAVARSNVAAARGQVVITQGGVVRAQAQLETAKAQAVQAQAQLDLIKAGSRAEDIAVAQAAVDQATASLAKATYALDDATLKSPFDGTVGEILVEEGQAVSPELIAVRVGDLSRWQVETHDLAESDVNMVSVGQEARVTVNALGGAVLTGKVLRIAQAASDSHGNKVYAVLVDLDPTTTSGLHWGMSAFVEFRVR